ncbi:MAG TPA: winged helix DNA-binding domain-containing protein [Thermoanaerobaculia bacterium]|nr:winged helix DNA-binding domain-containing protein [Thermoanaerobaculia bacterium]
MNSAIAAARLRNQLVTRARRGGPADVVRWLGAVQAQEYPFARWALGLRMGAAATDAAIERAFDDGTILRTHVLRPTWHFVTPADIRWMLELTAPHIHRAMASYNRRLELDPPTLHQAIRTFERALRDGRPLTRAELAGQLADAGLVARGQRLAHIVAHAELEGVVCSGPRRGKQFTYALLAERAPAARSLPHDEALSELTLRFFRSHGPATIRDFAWWAGLPAAQIKRGLEMNRARAAEIDGRTYWTIGRAARVTAAPAAVHLLPIYDEYLVAYRDREAVPHGPMTITTESRAKVMFLHALVIDGAIAGTWKPRSDADGVSIEVTPLRRLTAAERHGIAEAAERYGKFLDVPVRAMT